LVVIGLVWTTLDLVFLILSGLGWFTRVFAVHAELL